MYSFKKSAVKNKPRYGTIGSSNVLSFKFSHEVTPTNKSYISSSSAYVILKQFMSRILIQTGTCASVFFPLYL